MSLTVQEQLDEVQASISATLRAQGWSEGRRAKQNPQLATLFAERKRLQDLLSTSTGGMCSVAVQTRPT